MAAAAADLNKSKSRKHLFELAPFSTLSIANQSLNYRPPPCYNTDTARQI